MTKDPNIIDIPDDDAPLHSEQEVSPDTPPFIVIERDNLTSKINSSNKSYKNGIILGTIITAIIIACAGIFYFYLSKENTTIPISISETENIKLLADKPAVAVNTGIETFCDTVLGVALTFYPLDGLKAYLEKALPDTTDTSLVTFFRSSDYAPDGRVIGSVVVDGEDYPALKQDLRMGYVAMSKDGGIVIGIGNSDKIHDYAVKNNGSFFSQFMLVSDNTLPSTFELHGKVERAALGRLNDNKLYYVISSGRETMWGFADALREYGFIDAVYITGGNKYDFRRDTDDKIHLGNKLRDEYIEQRGKTLNAPILVFRSL